MDNNELSISIIEKAAHQYGKGVVTIEPLGEGLIHRTYKATFVVTGSIIVLQCINQHTFPQPDTIIHNYGLLQNILNESMGVRIPRLMVTHLKKLFWIDETGNFWRATEYIRGCYTASIPADRHHAKEAATCFAKYVSALNSAPIDQFHQVIPSFHDLSFRFAQFEEAIRNAEMKRLMKSTHVIAELRQRHSLVDFFEIVQSNENYTLRLMHHDCKINNVLFDATTHSVVCPVDLDTTMPGHFFSDLGDLIRTVACTEDENSVEWANIDIRKDLYKEIINGYGSGIGDVFSAAEQDHLHHAGLMLVYMQSMRFVTDYLNNDIYYRTSYIEQNLNRGLNQLILLERLEVFLSENYNYHPYA